MLYPLSYGGSWTDGQTGQGLAKDRAVRYAGAVGEPSLSDNLRMPTLREQ